MPDLLAPDLRAPDPPAPDSLGPDLLGQVAGSVDAMVGSSAGPVQHLDASETLAVSATEPAWAREGYARFREPPGQPPQTAEPEGERPAQASSR